ncbi:hypothetical protein RFI_19765 [Reticulomyxa filosa]|uniref:EF-hand domain-containing protein n=1 Tax=Reticulomyxa filosa TaxID=46433 RepID=X6MU93_RETFI|nr:hypothetical protein RFI_19765 [Reticulomyxa filosa]|eukprot:ETO17558.1 hypothetical protein RFI_19765 [Reticulomyxa filosa]
MSSRIRSYLEFNDSDDDGFVTLEQFSKGLSGLCDLTKKQVQHIFHLNTSNGTSIRIDMFMQRLNSMPIYVHEQSVSDPKVASRAYTIDAWIKDVFALHASVNDGNESPSASASASARGSGCESASENEDENEDEDEDKDKDESEEDKSNNPSEDEEDSSNDDNESESDSESNSSDSDDDDNSDKEKEEEEDEHKRTEDEEEKKTKEKKKTTHLQKEEEKKNNSEKKKKKNWKEKLKVKKRKNSFERLKEEFEKADGNNDGKITFEEFYKVCEYYDLDINKTEARQIYQHSQQLTTNFELPLCDFLDHVRDEYMSFPEILPSELLKRLFTKNYTSLFFFFFLLTLSQHTYIHICIYTFIHIHTYEYVYITQKESSAIDRFNQILLDNALPRSEFELRTTLEYDGMLSEHYRSVSMSQIVFNEMATDALKRKSSSSQTSLLSYRLKPLPSFAFAIPQRLELTSPMADLHEFIIATSQGPHYFAYISFFFFFLNY